MLIIISARAPFYNAVISSHLYPKYGICGGEGGGVSSDTFLKEKKKVSHHLKCWKSAERGREAAPELHRQRTPGHKVHMFACGRPVGLWGFPDRRKRGTETAPGP